MYNMVSRPVGVEESTVKPDYAGHYGATKNRPTYTGGLLIENHIFYMTTYIHSYNNYPNRIIILHTHIQITRDSLCFMFCL
jgi:hypothetical protein